MNLSMEKFNTLQGQRVNELCDEFYLKFCKLHQNIEWSGNDEIKDLSEFLACGLFSVNDILNFKISVGLQYESKY